MKQTNYNGKDPSIEALITQATSDEVIYHQNYLMIKFASNSIKPFLNFHESKESEISWVTKRFITPSVDHSFSLFKKKWFGSGSPEGQSPGAMLACDLWEGEGCLWLRHCVCEMVIKGGDWKGEP